jgi:NAD(P)H-hydrate epimerase
MRKLDSVTIGELGLPARVLMETAGKGCADLILKHYPEHLQGQVLVLCGSGNNGGDGAVIARWLGEYGLDVAILLLKGRGSSPEAEANLELCRRLDIPVVVISKASDLTLAEEYISYASLIVDAVYGNGFHGSPPDLAGKIFSLVDDSEAFTVSVDLPSGLDSDTGFATNAILADSTLSIGAFKLGQLIGLGKLLCGELHLVPIGIPGDLIWQEPTALLFTEKDFRPPTRLPASHKNHYGKVFVFGGISGYTGASVLSAEAALRSGAGYVYVLHRLKLWCVYENKLKEALTLSVPEEPLSGLPDSSELAGLLNLADVVLIGPGLGRDEYALRLLQTALEHVKAPLVVDADGLNLMAENRSLLKHLKKPNILITPHVGEFSRLACVGKEEMQQDSLSALRAFVAKYKARVLLKSHFSLYHDKDHLIINTSGNDGLATGGSGDVLAGIIASFLAQGLSIPDAAVNAAWLLGKTAEELATWRGTPSILPSDIIDNLFVKPEEAQV